MRECVDEEEHIEEEFELIIENFGNEGEDVVFGIFDDIIPIILGSDTSIEGDSSFDILHIIATIFLEPFEPGGG